MIGTPKSLDAHYVPFLKDEPANNAVRHLRPYLLAAEKATGAQATVILPRKANGGTLEALVQTRPSTTERTGRGTYDGGPVLAYYPSVKGLQLAQNLSNGWLGVVEWPAKWFDGLARYMGATNVVTGEKHPELSEEAKRPLQTSNGQATTVGSISEMP